MGATKLRGLSTWLIALFLCGSYMSAVSVAVVLQTRDSHSKVAVNIGMIYTQDSSIGKMALNCIKLSLSDFYKSHDHYNTRIVLHTRLYDPKKSVFGAAAAALHLLKFVQVKAIIGPTTSTEAQFVIHLGEKARVPIISYSATSPFLSPTRSPYFIRMAQGDTFQAKAISALVQAFGWREVVPIYVDDAYGAGLVPYLADALQKVDARIPYCCSLPLNASDEQILEQLSKLKTMQTRVFVVHVYPKLASRLFLRVNELEMMEQGYAWILTTGVTNGLDSLDHRVIESMQGVLGVRTYVRETDELSEFVSRWDRDFRDKKLSVMGLWAYDAAAALARAAEEVEAPDASFRETDHSTAKNLTDLDALGVSTVGPELLTKVLTTSFQGLAGDFRLADGQLEPSANQIINVIGPTGGREVGFWTPQEGLVETLNATWPGGAASPPKGWEVPTGGKKLRVGVPIKDAYEELVNVSSSGVTGFCFDVFDAVMEKLDYSGRYDFLPFAIHDGQPTASYDDLLRQVFLQNYDAVVGDITIVASRTSHVDFTLPYTESGVTMVVLVRSDEKRGAWVFLKPLTWDLWVTTLCAFVFVAFVIWLLEHRVNDEFRGPPLHQAGTSLFHSFSFMVFAQRENVYSNLARFVVVVWVFVVLILTQSYTASLTSMLTVQQLLPTVTDVNELLRQGASVGFQEGSFVKGLLEEKGFHGSKLVSYKTSEQLDDLLSKGSPNGGISAVFDEIPYMRLFLAQYPSKYIMVQPTYKTDGFGFAFPKGSPLAPEVSRGILNVTEGGEMTVIEKRWGMKLYNSSDQESAVTSRSLSLDSFWGLFLIAGAAAGFSLLIFAINFFHEHRHIWMHSNASTRDKVRNLAKAFMQRDIASHTFRRSSAHNARNTKGELSKRNVEDATTIAQDDQSDDSPPRPSVCSDRTEGDFTISPGATSSDDA